MAAFLAGATDPAERRVAQDAINDLEVEIRWRARLHLEKTGRLP